MNFSRPMDLRMTGCKLTEIVREVESQAGMMNLNVLTNAMEAVPHHEARRQGRGLAEAFMLVQLHNGSIDFDSHRFQLKSSDRPKSLSIEGLDTKKIAATFVTALKRPSQSKKLYGVLDDACVPDFAGLAPKSRANTFISTRRFSLRPSRVLLSATGSSAPKPRT